MATVDQLNQALLSQLASIAFRPVSRKTSDYDIALQIMKNSNVDFSNVWSMNKSAVPVKTQTRNDGHSTISRIIDVLSRPLYGMANVAKSELGNIAGGNYNISDLAGLSSIGILTHLPELGRGLSGKDKTTTAEIKKEIERQGVNIPDILDKGVGGFVTNLAGDIALDPLTFVGPGAVKGVARGAFKALGKEAPKWAQAAKAIEDAPAVSTALEESTKRMAIADISLSPQAAKLFGFKQRQEANEVLKAMDVSTEGKKTFNDIFSSILKERLSKPQQAIDKKASDIALVVSGHPVRMKFRGPKGKFLPDGAKVPTGPKPSSAMSFTGRSTPASLSYGLRNVKPNAKPGPVFADLNEAITRAVNPMLEEPIRAIKPGETLSERGVIHGVMARFATHLGQQDLRPIVLDKMTSAKARAEARIQAINTALKGFGDDEILEAWDIARHARPRDLARDDRVANLADELTGVMENFFRSRAIPENVARGNSVTLRNGTDIDDLNKMLERYGVPFKFTKDTVKNEITQKEFSYGKGTDWLFSWETFKPKDAQQIKQFLFGVQQAGEQLAAEYAVLDDFAARFGSRIPKNGHSVKIKGVKRLEGYYFKPEIADQISTALKTLNEVYRPNSKVTKFIAKATSMWKSGVTKYHPRHHIMNLVGDSFLMWIAGVNDPRVFTKAAKILYAQKGRYKDLRDVNELVGPDAIKNAMAKPDTVITVNKSGQRFTANQLYIAAYNYGLLQKASVIEDIASPGGPLGIQPFKGKVSEAFSKLSETREHYIKLAHFVDAVSKSTGKDYKKIFEQAAHEVRKWHPDGLDLTKTEQAIRANLIPFYSWTRKAIPLLIEGAVMRPQKTILAPARFQYNLQQSLGIQSSPSDLFPVDQMFPEWIQEEGIGPLGKVGMPGLAGFIGGLGRQDPEHPNAYTVAGIPTPFQEMFGTFGGFDPEGIRSGVLGMLNPGIKIPMELAVTKRVTLTDQPLYGDNSKDIGDYLTEQIPIVNQISRITNIGLTGPTSRGEKEGLGNREALINWLTGAGIIGTGPYIKSAEFEDIPRQKKQNKKYREFAEEIGYPLKKNQKIPDWIKQLYEQRRQ